MLVQLYFFATRAEKTRLTSPDFQKKLQRQRAHAVRDAVHDGAAGETAAENFLREFGGLVGETVSAYWPIGSELDTGPLLHSLNELGATCVLPVIEGRDRPLFFRRWAPGTELVPGPFRVPVPPENADVLVPTIIVAPLLAFDPAGYRLGYGGGYYDRTLEKLRSRGRCVAVGYAFAAQEVEKLVIDAFDQRLDWIVTEREVRKIG